MGRGAEVKETHKTCVVGTNLQKNAIFKILEKGEKIERKTLVKILRKSRFSQF